MYFNKCHQPENFAFPESFPAAGPWQAGGATLSPQLAALGEDVYRLVVKASRWPRQDSQAELNPGGFAEASASSATLHRKRGLVLNDGRGVELLASEPGRAFGVSGPAWLMAFDHDPAMRFYGLGEKTFGFEHSGKHTKFWNTDVWADFDGNAFVNGSPDPMYLSIPYLIVKRGNRYVGVLVNNPHAVFMSMNPKVRIAEQADAADGPEGSRFFIGAPDGRPEVYFLVGPSLAELTRKLQRLVGTTPLPPLWALGHQQCRWGYAGHDDLDALDRGFKTHRIPNDGLWVDIDYMTGYRVFTWEKMHWPKLGPQLDDLHARGRHVVPILDPGVKVDPAYPVYRSGLKENVFCQNPAGSPFVGFVWPGTTVFPDFSLPEARGWWARHVRDHVGAHGVTGVWLDMNDPATGLSENSEMRFGRGRLPHSAYHNQYALGMAQATHAGLLAANPDARPFILTRSGFTSIGRYAAAWTGDNFSNAHQLRGTVATSLNLALSGLPFNGPDVPGFGGDATPELAVAWYKAGFLFPFLRNHCNKGNADQEPWRFGAAATKVIRRYIRLRYKLLPYLYQLFAEQEATGEAVMRPLFYDFADQKKLPLDRRDDQFMMGPALMHAPVLDPEASARTVVLPAGSWFDARTGRWAAGGRTVRVRPADDATPLYVRDGSVVPMRPGDPADNETDLREIELHLFLSPAFRGEATTTYRADDGASFGYQRGERTEVRFRVRRGKTGPTVRAETVADGYGPLNVRFVVYGGKRPVVLRDGAATARLPVAPHQWAFTGSELKCGRTAAVVLAETPGSPAPLRR